MKMPNAQREALGPAEHLIQTLLTFNDHMVHNRPGVIETAAGTPIDCCTALNTGATCIIDQTWEDVPELSITFVPPTEGWIIEVKGQVSYGCESGCGIATTGEGVTCRIEKGGNEVVGTLVAQVVQSQTHNKLGFMMPLGYVDVNPVAGTSITYTIGCTELQGGNNLLYNHTMDGNTPDSFLSMIAYPPH
jgi:hypothetical protein